jgi:hypothetical protein
MERSCLNLKNAIKVIIVLAAISLLVTACGVVVDDRNLQIQQNGTAIISVGLDGFKLDGNVTGLTLDGSGLKINYPTGSLSWDGGGFNVSHADGSIHIDGSKMLITDKEGKQKELDTSGDGAEYKTDGGVLVRSGKKAVLPQEYPEDQAPLMEGFVLNASAELGKVLVVSGYVKDSKPEDVLNFYQPLLIKSDSYHQQKKGGGTVLQAKLDGTDITIYLFEALSGKDTNISIVTSK